MLELNNSQKNDMKIDVFPIRRDEAYRLIIDNHYANMLPKINHLYLGAFVKKDLVGCMTLGFGVRPKHTIKKLFPNLTTKDYWEIGRLCLIDEMPRNSESQFMSKCFKYVKQNYPEKKLIFSWSDGMLGKPGFVYQASNFLYGGYIWTDIYFTSEGERVHPRASNKIGGRPSKEQLKKLGWKHYFGKQFRYVLFLCSHGERKRLLKESSFDWSKEYPKKKDCVWKLKTDKGKVVCHVPPKYDRDLMRFNSTTTKYNWFKKHPTLESFCG